MKQVKKSVKIALISCISVVCLVAIILGCVFGIKKPKPNDNPVVGFTTSQKLLADEINKNSVYNSYELEPVEGAPYISSGLSYEDVVVFGANYFIAQTLDNGFESYHFYVFNKTNDGFEVKDLSELYGNGELSTQKVRYSMPVYNDEFVFIISDYGDIEDPSNNEIKYTNAYYSLIYYGDFDKLGTSDVEVYTFDATDGEGFVEPITLKDNYFILNYEYDRGAVGFVSDFYYYELSKNKIDSSVHNKISSYYYNDIGITLDGNDNGFYVVDNTSVNLVYLTQNGFERKTFENERIDNKISVKYNASILSDHKFLVEKSNYVLNNSELTSSSIKVDGSNGVFVNNSYFVYDYLPSTSIQKEIKLEGGYGKLTTAKSEALEESYYVCEQKVKNNELTNECLSIYFNKDNEKVLSYSSVSGEVILRAGTNTILTNYRLLKVYHDDKVEELVKFSNETYNLITSGASASGVDGDVFAITKNGYWGAMNIDGEILINPEDHEYVSDNGMNAPIINGNSLISKPSNLPDEYDVYLFDAKNKNNNYVTKINKFLQDDLLTPVINAGFIVYVADGDDGLKTVSILGHENSIKYEVKSYSIKGMKVGQCLELIDKDDSYITIYAEKLTTIYGNKNDAEQTNMNTYAIDNYVSSSNNKWTFWASDSWGNHDFSITAEDTSIAYYITYARANLTFSNTFDFYVTGTTISDTMGISATYSYNGGINGFNVSWNGNGVYYSGQFSYTWTGVSINSWSCSSSGTIVQPVRYYYNTSAYSSESNQIENTSFYKVDNINYSFTLAGGESYLQDSVNVTGGRVSSWYYSFTQQTSGSVSSLEYAGSTNTLFGLDKGHRYYYMYGYIVPYTYQINLDNQYATTEGTSTIYQTYNISYRQNPYYGSITSISVPSKIGYTFRGYYTGLDGGGTQIINSSGSIVSSITQFTADSTIYAYWTANSYSISYTLNGGSYGTYAPSTMYYDSTSTISNPTKTGYVFTGWSISGMSNNCEKIVGGSNYASAVTTAENVTGTSFKNMRSTSGYVYLTANWSVTTYNISYVYNNNGDNPTDYSNPSSAVYDTTFMVKNPVRRGYTFAGWTASNINTSTARYGSSSGSCSTSWSGTSRIYYSAGTYFKNLNSSAGTVTLTANWNANRYNLTYVLNEGTHGGSVSSYAYYDSSFYVPNPTRTGYRFAGWTITGMNLTDFVTNKSITHYYGTNSSTANAFTGATLSPSTSYTYFKNLHSDSGKTVTFTAKWTANTYNISYNYNNGKSGGVSPTIATFDKDVKISNPVKTGYSFVSWSISGMDSVIHSYGETVMTYRTTTSTSLTFAPTTNETWYKNLTSVHNSTITFSANWSANTYNINFSTNGAYNSYVDMTATYKYPAPTSTSDSNWTTIVNPVKTGYTFVSWSFAGYNAKDFNTNENYNIYYIQNGTIKSFSSANTNITFPAGVEKFMNLSSNLNNYVTFSANWSANVYNVTYNVGAGTADLSNPTTATYDQWFTINKPTSTPFGYYFAGYTVTLMNNTDANTGETVLHLAGESTIITDSSNGTTMSYHTSKDVTYFKNLHSNRGGTILITTIWNPNTYYLKYVLDDSLGSGYFESGALHPSSTTFDTKFTVSEPVRKGYTFMGWTLKDLTDDCTHYYYSGSSENSFTTTNGKYLDPENVNNYIVVKSTEFKNLRSNSATANDAVTLTATWKANNYNVTYHYMPSNFDTSSLGMGALNLATNMTATKNQTVTYDKEFITLKSSMSEDSTSIVLPLNVKLIYWAFYETEQSGLIATLDASGEISAVNSDYYFAQSSQNIFNFYGSNVHAYAVYKFTEITIKYLAPSSGSGMNDLSTYSVVNTGTVQNYAQYSLSYVPTVNSDSFIGWMLSANYYNEGYMTSESITQYQYNGTIYSTARGSTIIWAYNSSSAAHIDEPVYYLYAVYNYSITYSARMASMQSSNDIISEEIGLDDNLADCVNSTEDWIYIDDEKQ